MNSNTTNTIKNVILYTLAIIAFIVVIIKVGIFMAALLLLFIPYIVMKVIHYYTVTKKYGTDVVLYENKHGSINDDEQRFFTCKKSFDFAEYGDIYVIIPKNDDAKEYLQTSGVTHVRKADISDLRFDFGYWCWSNNRIYTLCETC